MLRQKRSLFDRFSIGLACGSELCWLHEDEWTKLIDLDKPAAQKLFVRRPENCSFRVWSESSFLSKTVPLKRLSTLAKAA